MLSLSVSIGEWGMDFEWISTPGRLRSLVRELETCSLLAVDTEFLRVDTFYPIPGLLQLADAEQAWLIDPLALPQPLELARLFYAQRPLKILHACYEDLEVIQQLSGLQVREVFDTQLAASYLGYGLQVGYQRLLQAELGIVISKEESRSDWLHRPLSGQQLQYAVQDVRYLLPLYEAMRERLIELGHWERVEEDNKLILIEFAETIDADELWREVHGAWRLSRQQLAVLRALCAWRERQARERNIPRGFLLKNESLLQLAARQPRNFHQLESIEGMSPRILRREAEGILQLIDDAASTPEDLRPALLPRPWPREMRDIMGTCRDLLSARAQALGLPVDVLIRKRQYEQLLDLYLADAEPSARFQGWRREEVWVPVMRVFDEQRQTLRQWDQERR